MKKEQRKAVGAGGVIPGTRRLSGALLSPYFILALSFKRDVNSSDAFKVGSGE
jgi:hypothetical protein